MQENTTTGFRKPHPPSLHLEVPENEIAQDRSKAPTAHPAGSHTSVGSTEFVRYREGGIKSTDQIVFTEKTIVLRLAAQQQLSECKETPHLAFSQRELEVAYQILLEHCLAIEAARPISADVLLENEEEKAQDLHWDGTGLEGLDDVLHGFEGRGIVEMTGKAGAGKTEADSVLDRLNIVDCFDVDELRSVLRDIDSSLAFSSLADKSVDLDDEIAATDLGRVDTASSSSVRIIVIDTLSNLLAPIITGSTTQGKCNSHD
ncbi:hypothetical protein QFC21_000129 [Naganishia friedmannii]|uniref:Uncharacterized protein n=1 Tax=Naganishia friedmannii TaxID=89922 RepID=A0ACC2WC95_9TREE|nr:hypothetical protein QFC21_000129 [Naganishia friedmannii]